VRESARILSSSIREWEERRNRLTEDRSLDSSSVGELSVSDDLLSLAGEVKLADGSDPVGNLQERVER
jgi:hypothetical protein